jgi:hypothetical protein
MAKRVTVQVTFSDGRVEPYVYAASIAQPVVDRYQREVAQPDPRWGAYPVAVTVY